jgi:formate dehydrogenase subunit delta
MSEPSYVRLANEIAIQFHHVTPDEGAAAVANHVRMFWDPRMRAQLLAYVAAGGEGLDPLVLGAADGIRAA